jgi:UDP-3-O-[3-hydroxymyristoyl] N-acetylglucosamine deacetylase
MQRATLRSSTPKINGIGIHSGELSWVRIHPANSKDIGQGIKFLAASDSESAFLSSCEVISTQRCTSLKIDSHHLDTVEHMLSALNGMGVSDAVIEFSGVEVPILDGSAIGFCDYIKAAGIEPLSPELPVHQITHILKVEAGNGSSIIALPSDQFSVTVIIEYPDRADIGLQAAYYSDHNFLDQIAPARTYGFISELDILKSKGLGLGASFENCIALNDSGLPDNKTPLRFENELARHKLLDFIGDLARLGFALKGHFVAIRPSHTVNWQMAKTILDDYNQKQRIQES